MEFDQSDWGVTVLLAVLGLTVLIAIIVIAKTFATDAKESKAKKARIEAEEEAIRQEAQAAHTKPIVQEKPKIKPKTTTAPPVHKDDVTEDDNLIAAAEVYLTYELKDQAITALEKHLLTNPTDQEALALLKKAEASD